MDPKYTSPPGKEMYRPGAPTGAAHQVVEQARRLTEAAQKRALATSEDKKKALSDHVNGLVDRLDEVARPGDGSEPAIDEQLIGRGVGLLRRFQRVLNENSSKDLLHKTEAQIKAHPGLFIAGCLALGFVGARLVRK